MGMSGAQKAVNLGGKVSGLARNLGVGPLAVAVTTARRGRIRRSRLESLVHYLAGRDTETQLPPTPVCAHGSRQEHHKRNPVRSTLGPPACTKARIVSARRRRSDGAKI